ncbi:MAG TPA: hypothetical protein VLF90_03110 [Patescibacteria group bacterium]|nr:hypothetical protein [Patescibacteria group bacterium]
MRLRVFRRRIKPHKFKQQWLELQRLCANRETWQLAVLTADKLLDEALKKRRFKGKSMGERIVSAQHQLTDNDGVWFAHNLAKKVKDKSSIKLRESDVKKSLVGVRQALRDLGALHGKN